MQALLGKHYRKMGSPKIGKDRKKKSAGCRPERVGKKKNSAGTDGKVPVLTLVQTRRADEKQRVSDRCGKGGTRQLRGRK